MGRGVLTTNRHEWGIVLWDWCTLVFISGFCAPDFNREIRERREKKGVLRTGIRKDETGDFLHQARKGREEGKGPAPKTFGGDGRVNHKERRERREREPGKGPTARERVATNGELSFGIGVH